MDQTLYRFTSLIGRTEAALSNRLVRNEMRRWRQMRNDNVMTMQMSGSGCVRRQPHNMGFNLIFRGRLQIMAVKPS